MLKKVVMVQLARWAKGVKGMQDDDGGVDDDAPVASGKGGKRGKGGAG